MVEADPNKYYQNEWPTKKIIVNMFKSSRMVIVFSVTLVLVEFFFVFIKIGDCTVQLPKRHIVYNEADGDYDQNHIIERSSQLIHSSLLYGLFNEIQLSDTSECANDVNIILDGIANNNVWALRILDANSNIPPSFVFGNNFWFSSSELCDQLNNRIQITLSDSIPKNMGSDLLNSTSPVPMKHRMVYANFTSPMQIDVKFHVNPIIHIGVCLPRSCLDGQVFQLTQGYLNKYQLPLQDLLQINMTVIATKSLYFDWKFITFTSFHLLCATIAFAFFSTLIAYVWQLKAQMKQFSINTQTTAAPSIDATTIKSTIHDDILQKNNSISKTNKTIDLSKPELAPSTIDRVIKCFNLKNNMRIIFKNSPSNRLSVISGIRTIACLWVLTFHVNYHSAFTISNIPQLTSKMEWFIYQPIFQAYLYVDTFFVLSGLLMVYNFLKDSDKIQQINSNGFSLNLCLFARHIFHRYIRLTPVLIVTMITSEVLYTYLEHFSPFWVDATSDLDCRDSWWQNILYIQNFYKLNTICSSWTWYLACDMQYYLVGLFILFVYAKNPKQAKWIYTILTVLMLSISFYLSYIYDLTYEIDVVESNSNILYTKPWTRMNPFLSGAFVGWILFQINGKTITIPQRNVVIYWLITAVIFFFTIFMTYKRDILTILCALMLSLGKYIFGLFIGSIIFMCHLGYGGRLTRWLCDRTFLHLSKLTFTMYMVSPMMVTIAYGFKEVSTHFDEMSTVINVIGSVALSYVGAIFFSLFFELPFQNLSDEFVMKRKSNIATVVAERK